MAIIIGCEKRIPRISIPGRRAVHTAMGTMRRLTYDVLRELAAEACGRNAESGDDRREECVSEREGERERG